MNIVNESWTLWGKSLLRLGFSLYSVILLVSLEIIVFAINFLIFQDLFVCL